MRDTLGAALILAAAMASPSPSLAQSDKAAQPTGPASGMIPGMKAPTFALNDQLGHQQSNQTVKGKNGTILLFFRSADW